jgi:hypothetical protein
VAGGLPMDLSWSLRETIDRELDHAERVEWSGQPKPMRLAWQSLPIVLFAIPWTAFAVFWTCGAADFKIPDFDSAFDLFPLFGLPFVLVGLGLLSTPFWLIRKARRTVYVVTDQRAIIIEARRTVSVRSFGPADLKGFQRKERRDGSGDITFGHPIRSSSDADCSPTQAGFLGIRDVRHVEELLRRLADQGPSGEERPTGAHNPRDVRSGAFPWRYRRQQDAS